MPHTYHTHIRKDTMLEDMGNAVKILNKIVPAVNIQVDDNGFSGIEGIPGVDDEGHWWGIYFEILFEDGDLWVVNQYATPDDPTIRVEMYHKWAARGSFTIVNPTVDACDTWRMFLDLYEIKLLDMDLLMMLELDLGWKELHDLS
jgi:hypothetical protein